MQKGASDGAALGALRGQIGPGLEGGPQGGSCESRACREVVGPTGRLQGQQRVPGAKGLWPDREPSQSSWDPYCGSDWEAAPAFSADR